MTYRFDENGVGTDAPTQMVIIVMITETGIIKTQMETTLLELKLSMDKKCSSVTTVNRSKGLMVILTVIYTHSTMLIQETL